MKNSNPVLLVEDDQVDAMTVRRALKKIHASNPVATASNGEEGLAWLENPDNPAPCIILLDINMPRMNGLEFLAEIKRRERYKNIPVVVLTTSKDEVDRLKSFDRGAAGYMVKPVDYVQFVEVIRTINLYWTLSELPG